MTFSVAPQLSIRSFSIDQKNTETNITQETQIATVSTLDRQLLDDIQKPTTIQTETKTTTQKSSVNQKAKDNELAAGVNLASMTTQPVGFELYMSALPDGQFYAPKEIYKGQKNVDNARLLRGLTGGSDRLHQQMIDSQYNLGN
jgi:hypothetical protein